MIVNTWHFGCGDIQKQGVIPNINAPTAAAMTSSSDISSLRSSLPGSHSQWDSPSHPYPGAWTWPRSTKRLYAISARWWRWIRCSWGMYTYVCIYIYICSIYVYNISIYLSYLYIYIIIYTQPGMGWVRQDEQNLELSPQELSPQLETLPIER